MATQTTHYNLTKPGLTDLVDVTVLNDNADIIDQAIYEASQSGGAAMIESSVEATTTSAHAYAVGEHFIYNDTLYRATAAIAIGDTITPGTNCVATNVMTEVESGGGGGGGTSDYTQLSNKPQINGVTLTGNKSLSDIGAASQSDLEDLEDITGDGQLSGFTATDLTGAANELRNTLTQLDVEVGTVESGLAIPQTGNNASRSIPAGAFIYLTGNSNQTDFPDGFYQNTSGSAIGSGATFTTSNLTRCYQETGALNTIKASIGNLNDLVAPRTTSIVDAINSKVLTDSINSNGSYSITFDGAAALLAIGRGSYGFSLFYFDQWSNKQKIYSSGSAGDAYDNGITISSKTISITNPYGAYIPFIFIS